MSRDLTWSNVRDLYEVKNWSLRRIAQHFDTTEDAVRAQLRIAKAKGVQPKADNDFTDNRQQPGLHVVVTASHLRQPPRQRQQSRE
jgi:predicted Rossmann fold nucleotide-binding protein DprA/Smf involved in DNA uptake